MEKGIRGGAGCFTLVHQVHLIATPKKSENGRRRHLLTKEKMNLKFKIKNKLSFNVQSYLIMNGGIQERVH